MNKKIVFLPVILLLVSIMIMGCAQTTAPPSASEAPASAAVPSAAPETPAQPSESAAPTQTAPPNSDIVTTNPAFPSGEEAYIRAEYGNDTSQYEMFADYMSKENIQGALVYAAEIDAFDKHLNEWVGVKGGSYNFSLPFPLGKDGDSVIVLQSNSMTGGVITHPSTITKLSGGMLTVNLQDAAEGTNNFGLGLFGFVLPAADAPADDSVFLLNTAEEKDGVIYAAIQPVTLKRNAENPDEVTPEESGDSKTYPLANGITVTVPDPLDFSTSMDIAAADLPKYLSDNARKVMDSLLVNVTIDNGEITELAYVYFP